MGGRVKETRDFKLWKSWGASVRDLAENLGWDVKTLWRHFDQLALMCEAELKLPRDIAEDSGFRLLRGLVEKQQEFH